ncbi:MAG: DNA gyrase inhibitor YacG [Ectothiorhodospiraceae bacterium]|nr:DNA gyrase inhibitor YacG [Ectothiorhodospiraceae bacterium]
MSSKTVKCPTCEKSVEWNAESRWRPFCCERCQLIDLGAWADESNRIPEATPQDFVEHPTGLDDKLH